MKTFESELPADYKEIFTVDATEKRTVIWMNVAAVAVMLAVGGISVLCLRPGNFFENYSLPRNLLFLAAMFGYIVLHELVHGLAYKLLTKQKLTFGLTLSVAYCGVPNIYVYRKTALIALLAPFVVFTVVFTVAAILFTNAWDRLYALILLALHLGGCVGDLYDTFLYCFRFKNPDTLMRDTGPKQTFYMK